MGVSTDYPNVTDWVAKSEGYLTGAMVRYQGNIFYANFWASEPGVGDADQNGWRFYDELYDQTPHTPIDQAKVIAYIPTWRKTEGFNYANDEMYRYITHGIIAFLEFDEVNLSEFKPKSLDDVNSIISDVVNTGHRNGTRISIALGGATDYGFLNLMTSVGNDPAAPLLDQAVKNVVQFVTSNNLDGVDLDLECWWGKPGEKDQGGRKKSEGPHPAGSALSLFAQTLKQAMPDKLVSAAVFGTSWYGNNYDPTLADHVDWLGVMTYDLTGSWNESPVGPHTALFKIRNQESSNARVQESYQESYLEEQQGEWPGGRGGRRGIVDNPILSVEDALWYWTNTLFVNWQGAGQKIPRNKVAAGVPIYGYDFSYGKEPDDLSGQVAPGYKVIRYKDILTQYPDAHTRSNGNTGNIKASGSTPRPRFISAPGNYPYAHNIYFETPDTAVTKLNFVKSVGAQGVIIWELSNDVWEENKSIIKALYRNSGNPAIRPPLPSILEPLVPFELMGVFTGKLSVSEKLSVTPGPFVSPGMPSVKTTIGTSGPPALAVYQGKLFCIHEGPGRDGWLWYCTVEPAFRSSTTMVPQVGKWSEDKKLGFGTSGPPAVAIYNGTLFCVHPGGREDGWLWCCTFDGTKWSEDTKLNVGVKARRHNVPCAALAVYDGKLFCVHEGQEDGSLWCCTFDGTQWSKDSVVRVGTWPFTLGTHTFGSGDRPAIGTSGAPALAVLNNKLLCFHEQSGETGWMWHCAFDGKEWSEDQKFYSTIKNRLFINKAAFGALQGVGTSGPPSASVHNSRLYLLHQGRGQDGHLHSINASAGHEDRDLSISMSGSPASAVYQNVLCTVYEGAGQDGSLYVSTTSLTESPIPTASPNVATGTFEIGGAQPFTTATYSEWIDQIRQRRGQNDFAVRLNMMGAQSPWVRLRGGDLYVVGYSTTQDLSTYRALSVKQMDYPNSSSLSMHTGTIRTAFSNAETWASRGTNELADETPLVFAFFISEAARFDGVQFAVDSLLRGMARSYRWQVFRPMLIDYSDISERIYNVSNHLAISLWFCRAYTGSRRNANNPELRVYLQSLIDAGYDEGEKAAPSGRSTEEL